MCTLTKHGNIYLLTLTGANDEHRLNPTLLLSLCSVLAGIRTSCPYSGSALVTAAEGKFFSNGFDQAWARKAQLRDHSIMSNGLRAVVAELMSLPMPTIAAVTGHAAAAGFALVLAHDYICMRGDRGLLYMSEVDVGIKITDYISELLRSKIGNGKVRRDLVMMGERLVAREAKRRGIVDVVVDGGLEMTVESAMGLGEELAARKWDGKVVAEIRKAAWPEVWRRVKDTMHGGGEEEEEEDVRSRL